MYWIGEIGEISAIVGRRSDFLQETPSVATWRFKDRDCLGLIDYTYAPDMTIRSRYYRRRRVLRDPWLARDPVGDPLHRRDARPAPGRPDQGTETTSYQVPMDWRLGFDGAARDFVDGLLEGRQPAQDVHTARRVLQVPLAIYEASRSRRPVAPESMT